MAALSNPKEMVTFKKVRHFNKSLKATPVPSKFPSFDGEGEG
jgi:hypothetical protein